MLEYVFSPGSLRVMGQGALLTVQLAGGALVIGVVLGVVGAMGRISRHWLPRWLATIYVEFIRGTPMLLQIMFLFIGVPILYRMITGTPMAVNPMTVGLIALGINSGAYTTELIRSGIQGVDKGQMEAARSLGLSYGRAMRHIILPQAFKRIIPPLVNEFIVLIKDSSLVSTIGVIELMGGARALGTQHYNLLPFLVLASLIYLSLTMSVSTLARRLERRLSASD
ncbi:MAG: amino acid ABC transporter permease [Deltaproteobacteria bacterium]|nr:amino acid ABC transporter permease [Deltaproteobacteria bacterium]